MSTPHPSMTTAQAKDNLRDWGHVADANITAQVNQTLETFKASTRKALPWLGGIAVVAGVAAAVLPRKKKTPVPQNAGSERPARATSFLNLALQLAPLVIRLLRRPRDD